MNNFKIDYETHTISNGRLTYQYGQGYLHNGDGASIIRFADGQTGKNYAYGFDGQYKNGAWDSKSVTLGKPSFHDNYVDIPVQTGQTNKIDRLYLDAPILEIIYQRNEADWTEDFIHAAGAEDEIAFVMHGMKDVVGLSQGKALWDAAEAQFGHNHGDHFLTVNGSSTTECIYDGHFIYGFIHQPSGHGVGFVYPTWITTMEWKAWWTEQNKIEIEYAPHGNLGRRWLFAVTGGRDEVIEIGKKMIKSLT